MYVENYNPGPAPALEARPISAERKAELVQQAGHIRAEVGEYVRPVIAGSRREVEADATRSGFKNVYDALGTIAHSDTPKSGAESAMSAFAVQSTLGGASKLIAREMHYSGADETITRAVKSLSKALRRAMKKHSWLDDTDQVKQDVRDTAFEVVQGRDAARLGADGMQSKAYVTRSGGMPNYRG